MVPWYSLESGFLLNPLRKNSAKKTVNFGPFYGYFLLRGCRRGVNFTHIRNENGLFLEKNYTACKIFTQPPVATNFNSGSNMLRWYSVSSKRGNSFCRTPSNFKTDPVLEKSDLLCLRVSFSQNFYFMICVAGSCRERIESEASPSERMGGCWSVW